MGGKILYIILKLSLKLEVLYSFFFLPTWKYYILTNIFLKINATIKYYFLWQRFFFLLFLWLFLESTITFIFHFVIRRQFNLYL